MSTATVATPAPAASIRASTDYLDGFRGILIIVVLLLHIFYLTGRHFYNARLHGPFPWYLETFRWYYPGLFTVGLFVVISGYCLMLPVVRSADRTMVGGVWDYMKRRARRILPPYYVAATLSLVHQYFFRFVYPSQQNPFHKWNLISHLFVFYNFDPKFRWAINGPYWSLAPEWQLYLLFPVLLVPIWSRFRIGGLMIASFVGTLGLLLLGSNARDMHPWFLWLFTMGMLGAAITESKDERVIFWRERISWSMVAVILLGCFGASWVVTWVKFPWVFGMLIPKWYVYCINETLLGTVTCAAIIHWTRVRRTQQMPAWPVVLRFLHHPKVMLLGRFSYSHYLVHYPILATTTWFVVSLKMPLLETMVVSYLIGIPASLALSYVFFLTVERRFLPKRLSRQMAVTHPAVTPAGI